MKNRFSRCLSVFLVVSFLLINTYSVSVKAAGPVISFQNDTEQTLVADSLQSVSGLTGKIRVSNLRLANLEEPKAGSVLDSRATVICDGGLFWEIPVVWVDENGSYSLICLPGKSYKPVLAFYIPKNVQVMNDPGSNSFSLKLPDFLNGIIDSNNLLMVKSDAYGITFIASADLANSSVGNNLAQTADTNRLFSAIVSNGQIDNFFKEKNRDKINNFVDFTAEQNAALAAEAARNSENNNTTQEASSSSENASSGTSSDTPSEPETPSSDVTITEDLIKLYCTKASIDEYGEDNLNKILNLIINVIEPQAVMALNNGFNAYSTGAKSGALGKEIGLYVYSGKYYENKEKDDSSAVAYVQGGYEDKEATKYGYYVGVNVDSLFKKDETTNEYKFNETGMDELNNSVVHELMHAYMDDYNRTGMADVSVDGESNKYPNWFIEGTATAVDDAYLYHSDIFDKMMDSTRKEGEARYTEASLLEYYATDQGTGMGYPSIDPANANYNIDNNRAADYVGGYLATLYLADLANTHYSKESAKKYTDEGLYYMESEPLRNGLNIILEALHGGTPLDDLIARISDNTYTDTADFQSKFLTKTDDATDASVGFCVDLLNYLDAVTLQVIKDPKGELRANGSILLDFETKKTSAIDANATNVPKQEIFVFAESNDMVRSTVDNEEALKTGGLRTDGYGEGAQTLEEEGQSAARLAIKEERAETKETAKEDTISADTEDTEETEDETKATGGFLGSIETNTDAETVNTENQDIAAESAESTVNTENAANNDDATTNTETEISESVTPDAAEAATDSAAEMSNTTENEKTTDSTSEVITGVEETPANDAASETSAPENENNAVISEEPTQAAVDTTNYATTKTETVMTTATTKSTLEEADSVAISETDNSEEDTAVLVNMECTQTQDVVEAVADVHTDDAFVSDDQEGHSEDAANNEDDDSDGSESADESQTLEEIPAEAAENEQMESE